MKTVMIGDREIGEGCPPLFVAELSGNHNGSLERALAIVDAMADAGAEAIKLQTYTPDTLTLDVDSDDFRIDEPEFVWQKRTLYDLYGEAMTPWEWHAPIFARARERGLLAFSSPFDPTAVDFLEKLDVPAYKIASPEIVDLPLIAYAAQTGKPLVISTGMSEQHEIAAAVETARSHGARDLVLLKCTSAYPTPLADSNLRTIPHMRELFGVPVGLSDHTLGIGAAITSVAFGAVLIEKHVTLSRADGGVDSSFSLEPAEVAELVRLTKDASAALGSIVYTPSAPERASLRYRRSLYAVADILQGEVFTSLNVRSIRPAGGLAPRELPNVIGRTARVKIARGTPLAWDLIAEGEPSS